MEREQRLYERAHERVEALKGFYVHAAIFVLVNTGLFAINALTAGTWWFYWPLIGWSIALGFHALTLFVFEGKGPLGEEWEERKTREMMEKEEAEKDRAATHRVA
jgi:hypothetical protein